MKLFLFLFSTILSAQITSASFARLEPQIVYKVETNPEPDRLYLSSNYANAFLENEQQLKNLKGKIIYSISLIYSQHTRAATFDQVALNKNRIKRLQHIAPYLFKNPLTTFHLIEQTKGEGVKEAAVLFHGFEIIYRKDATTKAIANEIKNMERLLALPNDEPRIALIPKTKIITKKKSSPKKHLDILSKKDRALEKYLNKHFDFLQHKSNNKMGLFFKKSVKHQYDFLYFTDDVDELANDVANELSVLFRRFEQLRSPLGNDYNIIITLDFPKNTITLSNRLIKALKTSSLDAPDIGFSERIPVDVVPKVFARNTHWKKILLVVDVTGSMSPYTGEILLWLKLNEAKHLKRIAQFTFFNDGDSKAQNQKIIGKTGGIYSKKLTSYNAVKYLMFSTMRKGGGGDTPENNLEAVISAIKTCSAFDEVVMIADNYATPRDIALLKHIKKPIRFVMCGYGSRINVDYVNLARKNGGSIHTIKSDILDLSEMLEGEIIEIDGHNFKLEKGQFIRMK
jgi:hypothetical protein